MLVLEVNCLRRTVVEALAEGSYIGCKHSIFDIAATWCRGLGATLEDAWRHI